MVRPVLSVWLGLAVLLTGSGLVAGRAALCPTADVVFVLDSSESVEGVFNEIKSYVESYVKLYGVDTAVQIGGVLFGESVCGSWSLTEYTDEQDLIGHVQSLQPCLGITAIGPALQKAQSILTGPGSRGYTNNCRAVVLFSDGNDKQVDDPDPVTVANQLRTVDYATVSSGAGSVLLDSKFALNRFLEYPFPSQALLHRYLCAVLVLLLTSVATQGSVPVNVQLLYSIAGNNSHNLVQMHSPQQQATRLRPDKGEIPSPAQLLAARVRHPVFVPSNRRE